jgi:hypothetical protein|tara:strand:+ start:1955 stop:2245 length:291 start_codon:yes stop_codon:yes gene_type:complete
MKFKEYYQYYISKHQNKWCRRLHVLGQLATISFVILVIHLKLWPLLLLTPFVVYPFAWTGHFVFEKNKPAAFSNPLWAKACDWIMLKDWFLGRIKR